MATYDIDRIRSRFPALARLGPNGRPAARLDGPAGTQVPSECLDGIEAYLNRSNANSHGAFGASEETVGLVTDVRAGMADLLGATDPAEVSFGPNMTTITFAVSRAIGQSLTAGDEIVVTRLDHDANVAPWLALAKERDLVVRWIDIDPEDCTLQLDDLAEALNPRTRLVAVGLASNAVGTINPVRRIADMAHTAGALVFVDAVHAAPHVPIDVVALDVDYLVCSAYKFYGPHIGVLWGRRELLEALAHYHVRPAGDAIPDRFETGTPAYELLAGLQGTLRHLEWVGATYGSATGSAGDATGRRERLLAAIEASAVHEARLVWQLIDGLADEPRVRVRGITDRQRGRERCPTIAFESKRVSPARMARKLGDRGIYVWDGDYYAWELIRRLGLAEAGGMVRVGVVGYTDAEEVERLREAVTEILDEESA